MHAAVRRVIPVRLRRWRRRWWRSAAWREIGAFRASLARRALRRGDRYAVAHQERADLARCAVGGATAWTRASARESLAATLLPHRARSAARPARGGAQPAPHRRGAGLRAAICRSTMACAPTPMRSRRAPYAVLLTMTSRDGQALARGALDRARPRARRMRIVLPWGSEAERARAHAHRARRCRDAQVPPRMTLEQLARLFAARARRDRRRYRPHASRRRARRAHRRHLLRLGSGADRHLRRGARHERRRARACRRRWPKCCKRSREDSSTPRSCGSRCRSCCCACGGAGGASPAIARRSAERFGRLSRRDRPAKLIWVHAVSVGEARAAQPLVRGAGEAFPDHRVLDDLHHRGRARDIQQVYGESVLAAYLPYDFPGSVQAFPRVFPRRVSAC